MEEIKSDRRQIFLRECADEGYTDEKRKRIRYRFSYFRFRGSFVVQRF